MHKIVSINIRYEYDMTISLYNDILFPDTFFSVIYFFVSSIFEFPVKKSVNAAKVNPNKVAIIGTALWMTLYNRVASFKYESNPLVIPKTTGIPHSYIATRLVNVEI